MKYHIISAIGKNYELGKDNDLIWRSRADLQHFKETTLGKPMVMGYKTLESLPCVLKGREHFVLIDKGTLMLEYEYIRDKYYHKQVYFYHSIEELEHAFSLKEYEEVMIVGGASIYKQFIDKAHKMTITHFPHTCEDADVFFPHESSWVCRDIQEEKVLEDGLVVSTYVREHTKTQYE